MDKATERLVDQCFFLLKKLSRLLLAERKSIIGFKHEAVALCATEKERIAKQLQMLFNKDKMLCQHPKLEQLKQLSKAVRYELEYNHDLLEFAQECMESVQALALGSKEHHTYSQSGHKHAFFDKSVRFKTQV